MSNNEQKLPLFCAQHQIAYQDSLAHLSSNKSIYVKAFDLFTNDLALYIKLAMTLPFIPADFTRILHTLKSSAATLGFTELARYAKKYEGKLIHYPPAEFSHFINDLLVQLKINHSLAITFRPMLENDLQATSNKEDMPLLEIDNEFMLTYTTLMEEVSHYNMNATNTFMKIANTLELITPQHIELLTLSINQLKFQQAETILAEIYPLLMDNQPESLYSKNNNHLLN